MAENFGFWPLGRLVDRYHPARGELTPLAATAARSPRPPGATSLFAVVLGELERRLNAPSEAEEPPPVPVSSNGHGDIEMAVGSARR